MEQRLIEIVVDPYPADEAMQPLWRSAWGQDVPINFAAILQRSLLHLVATDGDRLVGFVNVAWDGGAHAIILDTCVHRDYQRQGIATRLVQGAAKGARQRGAQWLHVDFEPHLEAFYGQCGFIPTLAGLIRL